MKTKIIFLIVFITLASCGLKDKYPTYRLTADSMLPNYEAGKVLMFKNDTENLTYGDVVTYQIDAVTITEKDLYMNPEDIFISRIIALPGDSVEIKGNIPIINGQACETQFVKKTDKLFYTMPEGEDLFYNEYTEVLPNNKIINLYKIDSGYGATQENIPLLLLGEDEYYLMSDSRSNTVDSRMYGPLKRNNIKGRILDLSNK